MIIATWTLFIALAVSGFMFEEIDMFFGNALLESLHAIFANVLYGIVIVHILAVVFVGWWGRIELIKPMITGKRNEK